MQDSLMHMVDILLSYVFSINPLSCKQEMRRGSIMNTIGKIITVALFAIMGVFAIVASAQDFLLYNDFDFESRTQTVQGTYNSYEKIRRIGKYGSTRKQITVDNQTFLITIADFDEEAFLNEVEEGDTITLVFDAENQILLSISNQYNQYLSIEDSLVAIKNNASVALIVGVSFISISLIGTYLIIPKRIKQRIKSKYRRRRKQKAKRRCVKWC